MNCSHIPLPGGGFAIACGRGRSHRAQRCRWCVTTPGAFQCDWKVDERRTCDKHICAAHAFEVGPEKHVCPEHLVAYQLWLRDVVGVAY